MMYTVSGMPSLASSMKLTPDTPQTLVISCGSATMAVVPWGTLTRASSAGSSMVLSMCMCPSMKPGQMTLPVTSTTAPASSAV